MNALTGLKWPGQASTAPARPVLTCEGLRVETAGGTPIVEDIAIRLNQGEVLGLVGESGSGKSTVARALLGYGQNGARVTGGWLQIAGEAIDLRDERAARGIRGRLIAYVPQNPASALNPTMRIGDIVAEMAVGHGRRRPSSGAIGDVMSAVGLPRTPGFLARYPHQLSGGQIQRVAIAVILVSKPPVVVLDEPTSGLDVLSQAQVLAELARLRIAFGLSIICVSHDLAVLSQVADRIAVMYAGRIAEEGPVRPVLGRPAHPYTQGLIASIPDPGNASAITGIPGMAVTLGARPPGCAFAPRCAIREERCTAVVPGLAAVGGGHAAACLLAGAATPVRLLSRVASETLPRAGPRPVLTARGLSVSHGHAPGAPKSLDGASFALGRGRCLAVVGASGSGKTTLARAIVGLQPSEAGTISLDGEDVAVLAHGRSLEQRRRIQLIPQDSSDALNPRQSVAQAIGRPLRLFHGLRGEEARGEIRRLLALVRLDPAVADRYPAALSGGERQRVSIARALAARPDILVCDEITSALDVSVQAAILTLLRDLRAKTGVSVLFISHDLGVVSVLADEILVLHGGRVVETGPAFQVLESPRSDHAKALLAAAPRLRHRSPHAVRPDGDAIPFPAKLSAGA